MPFPRRLLTEDETVLLDLHPHWIALVRPALVTILTLSFVIFVYVQDLPHLLALGAAAVWVILSVPTVLEWRFTQFVLTNERVISRRGVIAKHAKEIPIETINDVSFTQSILGRILKAGSLVIESAGEQGQEPFTNIPHPERVQLEIYRAAEARKGLSKPAARNGSIADELAKLADLRDRGLLTPEEFATGKQKLLGS